MIKLLKNLQKKEIIMVIICTTLISAQVYFDLLLPDFMSDLTVLIKSAENNLYEIWCISKKMIFCTLTNMVLYVICGYLSAKIAAGFSYSIRKKLFNHTLTLSKNEMQEFSVPSLVNRTTNDITQIQMFVSMGLQIIVRAPITAIWAITKILGKNWELSLLTMIFVFIITAISISIIVKVLPRFKIVQKLTDQINQIARENLTGINVVHSFNAENYQNKKFEIPNEKLMQTQMSNQKLFALFQPIMGLGMNGLSLCIYWIGAVLLNNTLTNNTNTHLIMFSNIVVFGTYATHVVMSFMMMIIIFMLFPAAQISSERINEILKTKNSISEGKISNSTETGTLEFKNVSFVYPGSNKPKLSNINFKLNKGETLGIIGPTASGKTTLVNLIVRLYDVTDGNVFVDGIDVKNYSFDTLYKKIGYVPQKTVLFSGSINENIKFGESLTKISDSDVDNALEISQAAEFVKNLKLGKNYKIAQSGKNLSGGQKQRLAIARALVRKPEILILDDSVSALDYQTEAAFRSALVKNLKDTTCIIISQRISALRHADKIIVLDDGQAVDIGTHQTLMNDCKLYREIALSQLSEKELNQKEG